MLTELLIHAVGLAVTPVAIAAGILFLASRRPIANSVAFAAPFAVVYGALSALVLLVSGAGSGDPLIDPHARAVIQLGVGVLLLAMAAWRIYRVRAGQRPKLGWMGRIDTMGPPQAAGIGFGLAVLNPNIAILFSGLAVIAAEAAGPGTELAAAAFLVLAAVSGLVVPILWYLVDRSRAERGLARVNGWLASHGSAVNLAVLVVFGGIFALKGLAGL